MGIFERYFDLQPNEKGEARVLCPFRHSKGYETRPSAYVNVDKRVFHCKTCEAEGRFGNGGLSEIGFFAELHGISYDEAARLIAESENAKAWRGVYNWEQATQNLLNSEFAQILYNRGLTPDTITKYRLGYLGNGIAYPVYINGELMDLRTYNPNEEPKIKSQPGATPLLFPFDEWQKSLVDKPFTVICEGENDCLLLRQHGYNAITSTGGAGQFPRMFLPLFRGQKVYVVYDCDEAGKKGALRVAFDLHEHGAEVYIVDLGLGDKEDVTDFFVKYKKTKEDFDKLLEAALRYSGEQYVADKNERYPVVNLWDVPKPEWSGKYISTRAMVMGRIDQAMEAPSIVEGTCTGGDLDRCETCPLRDTRRKNWVLGEENLHHVLELVEVKVDVQLKALRRFFGVPQKCDLFRMERKAKIDVYKVMLFPDVESFDAVQFTEQVTYILGFNPMDGQRYRFYGKRYPHPLQKQQVVLVVDRVEDSDNSINTFRMTPEVRENLRTFQGDPTEKMNEIAERAKGIVGSFAQPMLVWTVDLVYHSPLQFYFGGQLVEKGYLEAIIIGESRTGKSDTARKLQKYYGIGNFTSCKNATVPGLIGTVKNDGALQRIIWGAFPLNHRGLLVLDELSGASQEVFSKLTDLRSSGQAIIEKAVRGRAPAQVRTIWISNPRVKPGRQSKPLASYPSGVHVLLELVQSDEDAARFDFVVLVEKPSSYADPLAATATPYPQELYRQLIHWVWSRKPEQVVFDTGVEEYIVGVANALNNEFDTDVKLFGAEAWKKLARIAVACAARLFSCTPDGESILVKREHVDWARDFLLRCYDNDLFRLRDYVAERAAYRRIDDAIVDTLLQLYRREAFIIRTLAQRSSINMSTLRLLSGYDANRFSDVINQLARMYLIESDSDGLIIPSIRFREAWQAVQQRKDFVDPVTEEGA